MNNRRLHAIALVTAVVTGLGSSTLTAQDKYSVKVPGGLGFAEFKGFESWEVVSVSEDGGLLAVILANPVMIEAYKAGVPGNGKPFPEGSRMAKIHYNPKKLETFPAATVPASLHDVDFMVKDTKRFQATGGWGWAAFAHDPATGKFSPADSTAKPPQGHDAKCGFACHTIVTKRDFVFTDYGKR